MAVLPSGTVTFLFTDIEGSTRLWEQHPEAMRQALARHDALASRIITEHTGALVKSRGEGDSLFAVFPRATDALAAACALQQALGAEGWPTPTPLAVRMALHTGEAEYRDGDYYGTVVNRCARLRAAAHGGQVLLSGATQELVRDHLPDGVGLRDLGECRLRDLTRPERVFQLLHPALPSDFPALRTLQSRQNNLPVQPTPLLGREEDLAAVGSLLRRSEVRLVTLTGPGGTGKTRLALQVAGDRLDDFEDGAFFVDLAPLRDPELLLGAIAGALGVRETNGRSLRESLEERLREKALLLLLDNFEQLLPAAPRVANLLATAPHLKILVTSREALRLRGEHAYAVPPLALPPVPVGSVHGEAGVHPSVAGGNDRVLTLSQYAAVALFIERAVAAKSDFAVTNDNAPAVAEICHRLDGLPLAIELAAARARLFSPEALLARLRGRTDGGSVPAHSPLQWLTGGPRDAPARQQTLRDTISWSCDLLDEVERMLLLRLSIFAGGCTREAAEAVCGDDHRPSTIDQRPEQGIVRHSSSYAPESGCAVRQDEVLDLLASLVDKNLLRQQEGPDAEPRFTMLETIREFAGEQLAATGEGAVVGERHARYFMELAEEAERWLRKPEQVAWLDRLEREHRNLQAALDGCRERGAAEVGLRLGGALEVFWFHRGYWSEDHGRVAAILALPEAQDRTQARAKALRAQATLVGGRSDLDTARALLEEGLTLCRELDDRLGTAEVLFRLGATNDVLGDHDGARVLIEESLAIARARGDRELTAVVLNELANVVREQGHIEEARALYEEAMALWRAMGNRPEMSMPVNNLGLLALEQGDTARARSLLEESRTLDRERGSPLGIAIGLNNLGMVAVAEEKADAAEPLFRESLAMKRGLGHWWGCLWSLEGLAAVAALRGQAGLPGEWVVAARRFGAVAAARAALKTPASKLEENLYEPLRERVRAALDEPAFADAWAAGEAMTLQQAIAEALGEG